MLASHKKCVIDLTAYLAVMVRRTVWLLIESHTKFFGMTIEFVASINTAMMWALRRRWPIFVLRISAEGNSIHRGYC